MLANNTTSAGAKARFIWRNRAECPYALSMSAIAVMKPPTASLGQAMSAFRREHGMSQRDLAKFLGFSPAAVSDWESGKRRPDWDSLSVIADAIGLDRDQAAARAGYEGYAVDESVPLKPQPISPKLVSILRQLNDYELRMVEETAKLQLSMREHRARYEASQAQPPNPPVEPQP